MNNEEIDPRNYGLPIERPNPKYVLKEIVQDTYTQRDYFAWEDITRLLFSGHRDKEFKFLWEENLFKNLLIVDS